MEEFLLLLKCKPVDELVFLTELINNFDYTLIKQYGYDVYRINSNTRNGGLVVKLIKDLNIYIPKVNYYLSDFLLVKRQPTDDIIKYLDNFTTDDLFTPYISRQRINKAIRKP